MTAKTRCWLDMFMECLQLLHGRRFPLNQKRAVDKSYVRLAILHGSETCCLKESENGILRTERSMVRAMCGVRLKDRKSSMGLMFMLGLDENIDQLAMANSGHWHGHVLMRAWSCHEKGIIF